MHFEDTGTRFQPSLPRALGLTSITLHDLVYRHARLTITAQGSGSHIDQCKLDGVPQQDSFIPATLTGEHTVEITLSNSSTPWAGRAGSTKPRTAVHRAEKTKPTNPNPQKANASYANSQLGR